MITGTFSFESDCGLSRASSLLKSEVHIIYASPISKYKNIVCSFARGKNSWELRRELSSDFFNMNLHERNGLIYIAGTKKSDGFMHSLLKKGGVPIPPIIASRGKEYFTVSMNNKTSLDALMAETRLIGGFEDFLRLSKSSVETFQYAQSIYKVIGPSVLTPAESRTLREAYKFGFFKWPRDCNLSSISVKLNLSKVAVLYHIRNAERKLLSVLIDGSLG